MMIPASWRTTSMGLITIVLVILINMKNLLDDDPSTNFNMETVVAAVSGIGLLFARDNKVTSKDAGAIDKPTN